MTVNRSKNRRHPGKLSRRLLLAAVILIAAILAPGARLGASGQAVDTRSAPKITAQAMAQINALIAEKQARTPAERKIDSRLLYAGRAASGRPLTAGVSAVRMRMPMTPDKRAILDVRAPVTDRLLDRLRGLGVEIVDTSALHDHIGIRVQLDRVEAIAQIPEVVRIVPEYGMKTSAMMPAWRQGGAPPLAERVSRKTIERADVIGRLRSALQQRIAAPQGQGVITNVGSVTSQGDLTHRTAEARAAFGVTGAGVKIGVLSDGVDSLAASQANGNLGPVTVLAAGSGDEGTAMLEIVHDLAPGAQLYFATAFSGITSFANNIRALRAAGCDIIVDDVIYFVETPFQDGQATSSPTNGGVVIQAVKDVAFSGAMYFSSAGNGGQLSAGTSGTWEGDFVDGGTATGVLTGAGQLHNFGPATANRMVADGFVTTLHWSDPLGQSANDYDMYILDPTGTQVFDFSDDFQTGTQDPFEFMGPAFTNELVVIAKFAGAGRFLHLDTFGGILTTATSGEIHGHAATAAPNTFGVAATPACGGFGSSGPCASGFTSVNRTETFSSDGPRRVFFNASGVPFTPGNFSATGGLVLNKPDITAADGVFTSVPGFENFFGTSAAAPHAAAIAGLVKSAGLSQTAAQVTTALLSTAIDIHAPGPDRDSGAGIVMGQALGNIPAPPPPAPPTGLRVTRTGPATATVTWNPSASATAYTLSFSLTAGGTKTPLVTLAGTTVNVSGFTRGQTYFFAVSASNTGGASANSPEVLYQVPLRDPTGDIDGDGRGDLFIWRPGSGTWFWATSGSGFVGADARPWGVAGDKPLSGDIDGDGKLDLIVWTPSSGMWSWLTSSTGYDTARQSSKQWGTAGDVPLLGDLDGDGKDDLVVWRPSTGTWFWLTSSSGYDYAQHHALAWGTAGDTPMLGDFDGDGKADLIVWRGSSGTWFTLLSSASYSYGNYFVRQWGLQSVGDVPMLGDMDGDGKSDLVVWRASTGTFFWITSSTNYSYAAAGIKQWGSQALGDIPLLGDLDGDHRSDLIVWRPGNGIWFSLPSSSGYNYAAQTQRQWGTAGDVPLIK